MIERLIERLLFASRWLLAPLYLGLSLGLIALGIKFFQHAFHAIMHVIDDGRGGPRPHRPRRSSTSRWSAA